MKCLKKYSASTSFVWLLNKPRVQWVLNINFIGTDQPVCTCSELVELLLIEPIILPELSQLMRCSSSVILQTDLFHLKAGLFGQPVLTKW